MAELVDALDSKSSVFGRAGSIPAQGTKGKAEMLSRLFLFPGTTFHNLQFVILQRIGYPFNENNALILIFERIMFQKWHF